jgi:hypothetical protein
MTLLLFVRTGSPFGSGQDPFNTGRPIDEGTPGGQAGSEPAYRCGMKRFGCDAVVDV